MFCPLFHWLPRAHFLKLGVPHSSTMSTFFSHYLKNQLFPQCEWQAICITIQTSPDLQTLVVFMPGCFYGNSFPRNIYKLFFFLNLAFLLYPSSLPKQTNKQSTLFTPVTDIRAHRVIFKPLHRSSPTSSWSCHAYACDDLNIFLSLSNCLVQALTVHSTKSLKTQLPLLKEYPLG